MTKALASFPEWQRKGAEQGLGFLSARDFLKSQGVQVEAEQSATVKVEESVEQETSI